MPNVSVILPTFSRLHYLKDALASIFAQTYQDFEVIIIDDGSKDGTWEYISSMKDERLQIYKTARVGPAQARNEGVAHARGKWLAFCDSDDLWMPEKLEKQIRLFSKKEKPVMVFSDARIMIHDRKTSESIHQAQKPYQGDIFQRLLLDNFVPTSSVIMEKAAFKETPGFETAFCPAEDYRMWLRIAQMGRIECVMEPLVYYRRHMRQTGADLSVMFPACCDVITESLRQKKLNVDQVPGLKHRLWQLHFVAAREHMKRNNPESARRQYDLAGRYQPLSKALIFKVLSYIGM